MRKTLTKTVLVVTFAATTILSTSCATVFGGRITDYQRTKPAAGQPGRKVRVVPLIANIILFPAGIAVDFLTHAAYKPSPDR